MRQLRDADANVRYLATEGFCRVLMCEATDKYFEYIARLILLLFEKQPTLLSKQQEALLQQDPHEPGLIRITIEQFLKHFCRLSKQRTSEVYCGCLIALYYLLQKRKEPSWHEHGFQQINLYYLLGSIAEVLSFDYLGPQATYAIFEEAQPIAYNLSLFEFLANLALTNDRDASLLKFALDSLEFLTINDVTKLHTFTSVY